MKSFGCCILNIDVRKNGFERCECIHAHSLCFYKRTINHCILVHFNGRVRINITVTRLELLSVIIIPRICYILGTGARKKYLSSMEIPKMLYSQ